MHNRASKSKFSHPSGKKNVFAPKQLRFFPKKCRSFLNIFHVHNIRHPHLLHPVHHLHFLQHLPYINIIYISELCLKQTTQAVTKQTMHWSFVDIKPNIKKRRTNRLSCMYSLNIHVYTHIFTKQTSRNMWPNKNTTLSHSRHPLAFLNYFLVQNCCGSYSSNLKENLITRQTHLD